MKIVIETNNLNQRFLAEMFLSDFNSMKISIEESKSESEFSFASNDVTEYLKNRLDGLMIALYSMSMIKEFFTISSISNKDLLSFEIEIESR